MAKLNQFLIASMLSLAASEAFNFDKDDTSWFNDYPYDSLKHGTDAIPSIIKKLPNENKSFKKMSMPTINPTYCQEITPKDSQTRCYKCKDPSNGATYEHCSYTSRPMKVRRSSNSEIIDAVSAHSEPKTYRFGDDFFRQDSNDELQASSSSDNCKRERRDSMLCMICRDPKTNGKYEQCSYVGQQDQSNNNKYREPHKQQQQQQQRRSKQHQQQQQQQRKHREPEQHDKELSSSDEQQKKTYIGYPSYLQDDEDDDDEESTKSSRSEKLKSSEKACKSVKRDGETCTVCTDPKSGAKSEKCNYSFEPKDKAYAYTKSKSFGYPSDNTKKSYSSYNDKPAEEQENEDDDEESTYNAEDTSSSSLAGDDSNQDSAEDYSSSYASPDYIRSESERISQKVRDKGDCREVKRDSSICKICKDPRTGDDFEQCNYSYEPDDKVYAYSKSKHFGSASPSEYSNESDERSQPEESSSVLDYLPKPSESQHSDVYSSYATPSPNTKQDKAISRVDTGFYDAAMRRAEIEKIVKSIGATTKDRSKCSKTYKDGMTCYSCKDDKGFHDEECVFVTEPEIHFTGKPNVTTTTTTTTTMKTTSSRRRRRRSHEEKKNEDTTTTTTMMVDEVEPYDYVAETRPIYDKVLGLTLPAYMVKRSQQELEFDQSVENSKF